MNYKEVSIVLSGMNNMEHIKENIKVATETLPNSLSETQLNVIEEIKKVYDELMRVLCTGCNYCMPCPMGVDIPSKLKEAHKELDSVLLKYPLILATKQW